ncbi:uncharacterized protein LOC119560502 [Drosophila subpulchrella]|uniref:uncharacterized protein LOC119560502 n=1 Tax=Drosophila subpulchrella TaxID=1486046 RepID=UPI0018A1ADCD|nr:uncharacterized protein LOC119560502 [Drosophila subpulchrella]
MRLTWLSLFWVSLSSAQNLFIPKNYCGSFFQYAPAASDGHYMGIFTAPSNSNLKFNWEATFVIKEHRGIFVSSLMPYHNEEDSASSIPYTKKAQVFVSFLNINNELPKLILLTLNGWTLCSNEGYGPNSTTQTVKYTMDQNKIPPYPITTQAPRKVSQPIPIETMD